MQDQRKPTEQAPETPPVEGRGDTIGVQAEVTFARNMRALREDLGVSQAALAKRLEWVGIQLDSTAITRMEKWGDFSDGARLIRLGEAVAIARVLGTTLFHMLTPGNVSIYSQLKDATEMLEQAIETQDLAKQSKDDAAERVRSLQGKLIGIEIPSPTDLKSFSEDHLKELRKQASKIARDANKERSTLEETLLKEGMVKGDGKGDNPLDRAEERERICRELIFRIDDQLKFRKAEEETANFAYDLAYDDDEIRRGK